jgi:hypothetical protein
LELSLLGTRVARLNLYFLFSELRKVTNEFYMKDLADRRSYNFGDTFGDPVETDSLPTRLPVDGSGYNQADALFEQDDAVLQQGGAA